MDERTHAADPKSFEVKAFVVVVLSVVVNVGLMIMPDSASINPFDKPF